MQIRLRKFAFAFLACLLFSSQRPLRFSRVAHLQRLIILPYPRSLVKHFFQVFFAASRPFQPETLLYLGVSSQIHRRSRASLFILPRDFPSVNSYFQKISSFFRQPFSTASPQLSHSILPGFLHIIHSLSTIPCSAAAAAQVQDQIQQHTGAAAAEPAADHRPPEALSPLIVLLPCAGKLLI